MPVVGAEAQTLLSRITNLAKAALAVVATQAPMMLLHKMALPTLAAVAGALDILLSAQELAAQAVPVSSSLDAINKVRHER
jgi:hypothetical protein